MLKTFTVVHKIPRYLLIYNKISFGKCLSVQTLVLPILLIDNVIIIKQKILLIIQYSMSRKKSWFKRHIANNYYRLIPHKKNS